MKRFLCHTLGGAALALSFSFSAPVLAQENIAHPGTATQSIDYYDGTMNDVLTTSVTPVSTFHKSNFVTGNTVTLNSNTVSHVFGAVNFGDTDALSGNRAVINGGTVRNLVEGALHVLENGNTSALNNRVEINGGTVGNTTGGQAASDVSGDALASNNTVVITGGTINGIVFGGLAGSASGQAVASNNTVRIGPGLPATVFGSNALLVGGYANTNTGTAVSTGNTLQIESAGLSVERLGYFQRFEFTLPAGLANSDTVLISTAWTDIGTNAVMTVSAAPGFTVSPGDAFILIDGTGSTFSGTVAAASQSGTIGGYPYTLAVESDTVVLRILQPVQSRVTTSVPVAGGGVLAALGLLLAGLAAAGLRRRRC
ncbi:MAG: hypothetical protein LBE32_02925 [Burkholderiales bacterium]|jgi:hypothetical protein|nr:hypothetical protein [Burkholderiales bacterium]